MPDISQIQLPNGDVYDIKDSVARQAIAGGVTFIIAWNGTSTPVVADIPQGVKVTYNNVEYTGTLSPETSGTGTHAQAGAFYLVYSPNDQLTKDVYDEYVPIGSDGSKTWEMIGNTDVSWGELGTLAKKNSVNVELDKKTDYVLGYDTTFSNASSSVTFSGGTTDGVLGDGTTFVNSTSAVTFAAHSKDNVLGEATTFVNSTSSVSFGAHTTASVNNITLGTNTTASKAVAGTNFDAATGTLGNESSSRGTNDVMWGASVSNEVLSFSFKSLNTTSITPYTFSNVDVPVVSTVQTVNAITALGAATAGSQTITVGTNDKVAALIGLGAATAGSQTITVGTNDKVTAITGLGTATAAAQTITVGSNDKVEVLKSNTGVTVTIT